MPLDVSKYEDEQLLQLLANDSEPALKELYERYWESLFTKAFNFLQHQDAAGTVYRRSLSGSGTTAARLASPM